MHYYQHNIGDYRRDTGHLSLLEHGVYRQLLDMYYLSESPIPRETQQVFRRLSARTQEEQNAVEIILNEFFELSEEGWTHKRCDVEISDYRHKASKSRENGKRGGRPKSIPEPEKTQQVIPGNPEHNQNEPELINQLTKEPINQVIKEKNNKKENSKNLREELSDVTDQTFSDFIELRKAKKAPVTLRAIEGIRSEAEKAGISLENALIECCSRGWIGFKAEWYCKQQAPPQRGSPVIPIDRSEYNKQQTALAREKLFGTQQQERDVTNG